MIKCIVDGVAQMFPSKGIYDGCVRQYVYSATDDEFRKARCANAVGFALVNQRNRTAFDGIGDRCRFTVIERFRGASYDQVVNRR